MDSWKSEANLALVKNDPTDYYTKMNGVPFEIWWNQIHMTGQLW